MRKIVIKPILIILLGILFIRCDKDDIELNHVEGYIVGFVPCTANPNVKEGINPIGYVIISEDLKDTLSAYNLSDVNHRMPAIISFNSNILYEIPDLYFQNYRETSYFSNTLRYRYRVKISYIEASEDEKVYPTCKHDINQSDFNNAIQVIIKSATKN
jgi:hypothetical protein